MRSGLRVLVLALLVFFTNVAAHATGIVLDSASGGNYSYGLAIDPNGEEYIPADGTITLTGLSGVTGVSTMRSGEDFSVVFTATSVTLTYTIGGSISYFAELGTNNEFPDLFTVTSTSGSSGMVDFDINGVPEVSGTVEGPVAAAVTTVTPEPSSLVLLGTGALGLFGAARRRFLNV